MSNVEFYMDTTETKIEKQFLSKREFDVLGGGGGRRVWILVSTFFPFFLKKKKKCLKVSSIKTCYTNRVLPVNCALICLNTMVRKYSITARRLQKVFGRVKW